MMMGMMITNCNNVNLTDNVPNNFSSIVHSPGFICAPHSCNKARQISFICLLFVFVYYLFYLCTPELQWNNGFVPLFLNISHKTYFCSSGDRAFRLLLLRTVFTSWSIGSMMGHNRSPGYLQTHLSLRCRIFNISEILPASQTCISLYHVDDTIQYKITWTNVKTQTRKHFKTLRTQPLISPKRLWEKACQKGSLVLAELCICCVFVFVLFFVLFVFFV